MKHLIGKRIQKLGRQLKKAKDNHVFWIGLTMINSILALIVAFGTISAPAGSYIAENITWHATEQSKIDKLAPTQTIDYFNSILGQPNIKKVSSTGLTRYIYRERAYWVEAFTHKDNTVVIMDITACGENGFTPTIKNNPVGGEIILGKSKMVDTTYEPEKWGEEHKGPQDIHYFLRGATAPSYFYDEYYYGNPSNYQTVFTGFNELCGYLNLPKNIRDAMEAKRIGFKPDANLVNKIRENVVTNTFAVTAPNYELALGLSKSKLKIGEGGIGVSYVDAGTLQPSPKKDEYLKRKSNTGDFEVTPTSY